MNGSEFERRMATRIWEILQRLEAVSDKRAVLLCILLLCLLLRLGMAIHEAPKPLTGDALTYVKIAVHIAGGDGFVTGPIEDPKQYWPTAFGNPIYPAFLAGLFKAFGFSVLAVLIVQCLIDTLTCFLVFVIALKVVRSRSAALLAALAYALYPPFIISAASVLTETLTLLLLTGALYFFWRLLSGSLRHAAFAGVLMGLSILIRPAVLLLPVFLLAVLWLNRKECRGWLLKGLVYLLVSYAVVSPWTVRNYVVMGGFIPVSAHGGLSFWQGTGPADGVCMSNADHPLAIQGTAEARLPGHLPVSKATYHRITSLREQVRGLNEVERDAVFAKAGMREVREHPGRFAFLAVKKFFRLWFNLWYDDPPSKVSFALAALNLALLGLALRSVFLGLADRGFSQIVLSLATYTTLVSVVSFAVVRYSYPAFPFVIILAAAVACERK